MLQAWLKSLMRLTNLLKDPHCGCGTSSAASGCTEKSQHELLFNSPSIHNDTSSWQSRGSSQKGHATFGGQSCWPREISPQLLQPLQHCREDVRPFLKKWQVEQKRGSKLPEQLQELEGKVIKAAQKQQHQQGQCIQA